MLIVTDVSHTACGVINVKENKLCDTMLERCYSLGWDIDEMAQWVYQAEQPAFNPCSLRTGSCKLPSYT